MHDGRESSCKNARLQLATESHGGVRGSIQLERKINPAEQILTWQRQRSPKSFQEHH